MNYNTCPKCKTKISADLAECPECGSHFSDSMQEHSTPREKSRVAMLPTVIAGVLIFIAFAGGLLFNASRHPTSETPISTPEIVETIWYSAISIRTSKVQNPCLSSSKSLRTYDTVLSESKRMCFKGQLYETGTKLKYG